MKTHLGLRIQLDGVNYGFFFLCFLGRLYITMLKQMGGCFALIGKKKEQKPLYKGQKMYLEEIDLVESMIINQNCIRYYNSQDKDLTIKLNTYGCFIEKCNSMVDLLLLTKHDFLRERSLKESMFGKKF